MRAVSPLAIREEWGPDYTRRRGHQNRDFAFGFADAQGAHSASGTRYHSAVDWFAPAGTPVCAPTSGDIIRADRSTDDRPPVYGGVLVIECDDGRAWVMRHVQPGVALGARVGPGQAVATVSPVRGIWAHLHLEYWLDGAGGYRHENMLDPQTIEWGEEADGGSPPPAQHLIEELPHDRGGHGPVPFGPWRARSAALRAEAAQRARGRSASRLRGEDGGWWLLWWAPGTYGRRFRWGPWAVAEDAAAAAAARERNTSRTIRRYEGRARSLYPWPSDAPAPSASRRARARAKPTPPSAAGAQ